MTPHPRPRLTDTPAWQALAEHRARLADVPLTKLFDGDAERFRQFSAEACGILLDYSKQHITAETMTLLFDLAQQQDVAGWRARMFAGERINRSEDRPVLHVALRNRSNRSIAIDGRDVMPGVNGMLAKMHRFVDAVRFGTWTGYTGRQMRDVVHIGIGGSHLGPQMVVEALRPYHHTDLQVRFVANVDGTDLAETLGWLDPETTLFIIASKTFTTMETMANAGSARTWFLDEGGPESAIGKHFVAITSARGAAEDFGIDADNLFEVWDWVGGRFSLWSAMGLPVALAVGMDHFERMLAGAHAMDEHFRTARPEHNMPLIMGLIGVWNVNFRQAAIHAVLPYDQYLAHLPAHLQQLEMESNGKSVDRNGRPIDHATCPIIFGQPGTNGQHAFHQLLHQGPTPVPADFLVPVQSHNPLLCDAGWHHDLLLAHCLAQAEALMRGHGAGAIAAERRAEGAAADDDDPAVRHRVCPGNRPSSTLLFRMLDPYTLGALVALYEHKVFVQGVLWEINSFDQWGVELGKRLAGPILRTLAETDPDAPPVRDHDASTNGLIAWIRAHKGNA